MKGVLLSVTTALVAYVCYRQYPELAYFKWDSIKETDNIIALAKIDLSNLDSQYDTVSKELFTALHEVGFAYVTGIDNFDEDELFKWTKWFFDLPLQTKMAIAKSAFNQTAINCYRGYFPVVPGHTSYKEAFEIGSFERNFSTKHVNKASELRNTSKTKDGRPYMRNIVEEQNSWPESENDSLNIEFRRVMLKYFHIYDKTLLKIFQLCLHSLGYIDTEYDHWFAERALSTFRLLHYPSRLHDQKDGHMKFTTAAHYDTSMLTLLSTFNYTGLQVRPAGQNKWLNVPPKKNHLVVNIGALLADLTDNQFLATDHRVLDIGDDRYSLPMFLEPHFDADVSKTFSGKKNELYASFKKYGKWMTNRTSQYIEYATTDFGV